MTGSRSLSGCIVFVLNVLTCSGQTIGSSFFNSLSVSTSAYYGFNNSSNPKLETVENSHPFFGQLDISFQTTGKRIWQQVNGYPEIGLSLLYGNSGASQYLGNIAAFFPFVNFPLYSRHFIKIKSKFGLGLGWVEKPFDPESNFENLVIGSHLNACMQIQFSAEMKIQKHLNLVVGVSITHLSNGSIRLPNLGLNIPALSAGLKYTMNPALSKIKSDIKEFRKKVNYYLFTFVAIKEAYPIESPLSFVNLVSFEILKDYSYTGRFGGGINLTYDRALRNEVVNSITFAFDKSKLKLEASIYGSYEYVLGNLSIPIQLGAYLYNNYPVTEIYEMIGLRYRFFDHWIAGIALKAHFSNGDFIQWGVGYKF